MTLFLGSQEYGKRRWQDWWFWEETIEDYLSRPMVKTCSCGGINGEHFSCCPVSVAMAARINTLAQAKECAKEYRESGFNDLANHWDKVAERIGR